MALVAVSLGDCEWEEKGIMVKEGEVTGFKPDKGKVQVGWSSCWLTSSLMFQVCTKKGKLKFKKEKKVPKPYKFACDGE